MRGNFSNDFFEDFLFPIVRFSLLEGLEDQMIGFKLDALVFMLIFHTCHGTQSQHSETAGKSLRSFWFQIALFCLFW